MKKLFNQTLTNNSIRSFIVASAIGFIVLQSTQVFADDRHDRRDRDNKPEIVALKSAIQAGELLNIKDVADLATKAVPGHITSIELDHEHNVTAYEIKILDTNGTRRKLEINAKTGEILSTY